MSYKVAAMLNFQQLTSEQKNIVTQPAGFYAVEAGPGTGKTTVIIHRILHQLRFGMMPEEILVLTFSRRDCADIRRKLRQLGKAAGKVEIRTSHSFAWKIVSEAMGDKEFQFVDSLAALIQATDVGRSLTNRQVKELAKYFAFCLASRQNAVAEDFLRQAKVPFAGIDVEELYDEIRRADGGKCRLSYQTLLDLALSIFNPASFGYKTVIADEVQDFVPVQCLLLAKLVDHTGDALLVFDNDQAIYRFMHTDAEVTGLLTGQAQLFRLTENFRSTQPILDCCAAILGKSQPLVSGTQATGDLPGYQRFATEQEEALWIARKCKTLIESGAHRPEDIVILLRNLKNSRFAGFLADAFRFVGLPGGAESFVHSRFHEPLQNICDLISIAQNPSETRLLPTLQKVARITQSPVADHQEDLRRIKDAATASEAIDYICSWLTCLPGASTANYYWLDAAMDPLSCQLSPIEFARKFQHRGSSMTSAVVKVKTIHSAKGSEAPVVFVPQLSEGQLPSYRCTEPAQIDEEWRVLYVAASRAEQLLFLSSSAVSIGGNAQVPSRFLTETVLEKINLDDGQNKVDRDLPAEAELAAYAKKQMVDELVHQLRVIHPEEEPEMHGALQMELDRRIEIGEIDRSYALADNYRF